MSIPKVPRWLSWLVALMAFVEGAILAFRMDPAWMGCFAFACLMMPEEAP